MTISRRSFLTATAAFLAAPAIVRASSLMPVKAEPIEVKWLAFTDDHTVYVTSHRNIYFAYGEELPPFQWSHQNGLTDWTPCPDNFVRLAT